MKINFSLITSVAVGVASSILLISCRNKNPVEKNEVKLSRLASKTRIEGVYRGGTSGFAPLSDEPGIYETQGLSQECTLILETGGRGFATDAPNEGKRYTGPIRWRMEDHSVYISYAINSEGYFWNLLVSEKSELYLLCLTQVNPIVYCMLKKDAGTEGAKAVPESNSANRPK